MPYTKDYMDIDGYAIIATLGGIIDVSEMSGKEVIILLQGLFQRDLLAYTYQKSSDVLGLYDIKIYITTSTDFSIKFKEYTSHLKKRNTYMVEVPSV